jgi:hypothetical protein
MKKAVSILIMLALVAVPCLVLVSPVKGNFKTNVAPDNYSTISVAFGNATNGETILVRIGNLPSPLIIATLIIALVALFGAILSLYLRWRDRKLKK